MTFSLMSPAFAEGQPIPKKYTRFGENIFPPLKWTGTPDGTQSFALIVEDPDAQLPEAVDTGPEHAIKFIRNDFGNARYDGPQPPAGTGVHHYHFKLAALNTRNISISDDVGAVQAWTEARKHRIAEAALIGTYQG
ncbi:YbhB/YbcL family Raf kinase inhibitor-like protein [Sinorhizobium fredii]|uniref:YbhB/YbcL family Raf kinase inhibitor-like protein n=1 Tax=Rhizobium fredii TaxID=380 RepID=UPI00309990F5